MSYPELQRIKQLEKLLIEVLLHQKEPLSKTLVSKIADVISNKYYEHSSENTALPTKDLGEI